jgi:DNA mismatch endonuclease (patch repair protein)
MADNMSREQRSHTMSRIRSKNTEAELMLRTRLHRRGFRYRIHAEWLPGKPDIAFTRRKLAVFVDGDFWHGRNFDQWSHKLNAYWQGKIERNRRRDAKQTAELKEMRWTVLRIWERDIKSDPSAWTEAVISAVQQNL